MAVLGFVLSAGLGGDPVVSALNDLNNISRLLVVFGKAVQGFESAGQEVWNQRSVDTAIGVQLDDIGLVVGQPRGGLDDETYRRYVRAAIKANRSNGTVFDVLRVLRLVIANVDVTFQYEQQQIATAIVRVLNIALTDALGSVAFSFLERTAAAGVIVMLEYGLSPFANWFRFDSGPGFDEGYLITRLYRGIL
jgi:hypothetical protein